MSMSDHITAVEVEGSAASAGEAAETATATTTRGATPTHAQGRAERRRRGQESAGRGRGRGRPIRSEPESIQPRNGRRTVSRRPRRGREEARHLVRSAFGTLVADGGRIAAAEDRLLGPLGLCDELLASAVEGSRSRSRTRERGRSVSSSADADADGNSEVADGRGVSSAKRGKRRKTTGTGVGTTVPPNGAEDGGGTSPHEERRVPSKPDEQRRRDLADDVALYGKGGVPYFVSGSSSDASPGSASAAASEGANLSASVSAFRWPNLMHLDDEALNVDNDVDGGGASTNVVPAGRGRTGVAFGVKGGPPRRGANALPRSSAGRPDAGTEWEARYDGVDGMIVEPPSRIDGDDNVPGPGWGAGGDEASRLRNGRGDAGVASGAVPALGAQELDAALEGVPGDLVRRCWERAVHNASCTLSVDVGGGDGASRGGGGGNKDGSGGGSGDGVSSGNEAASMSAMAASYCDALGIECRTFKRVVPGASRSDRSEREGAARFVCHSCGSERFHSRDAVGGHFLGGGRAEAEGPSSQQLSSGCCWGLVKEKQADVIQSVLEREAETVVDGILHAILSNAKTRLKEQGDCDDSRGEDHPKERSETFGWLDALSFLNSCTPQSDLDQSKQPGRRGRHESSPSTDSSASQFLLSKEASETLRKRVVSRYGGLLVGGEENGP